MGVNMISKNSLINAITVKDCDMYGQCLYRNVLHNHNSYELNVPLKCIFRWRYGEGNSKYILF